MIRNVFTKCIIFDKIESVIKLEYIFTDEQWQEVYQCFSRWSKEGVFENIFKAVIKAADTSEISIDSTFVKVHQPALIGKPIKINL